MEENEHIADETTATDEILLQRYGEFPIKTSRCVICYGEHLKNFIFKNEYDLVNCITLLLFL
jgi:hypothetical protein